MIATPMKTATPSTVVSMHMLATCDVCVCAYGKMQNLNKLFAIGSQSFMKGA